MVSRIFKCSKFINLPMICKLCGQDHKLVKAHVIPESFFRPLRSEKKSPLLISAGNYIKRAPIGVYDKTILCEPCEQQFGIWDDYAQSLLIQDFQKARTLKKGNDIYGYVFDNFDYDKLKLFFISMLWRASISSLKFYENVRLNVFEDVAKDHIKKNNPGTLDDFSVMLAHFDELDGRRTILNPQPIRMESVNFYRFYLTGFIAYIKVDKRKILGHLRKFIMSPGRELPIVRRPFNISAERKLLSRVAKSTKG